MSRHNLHHLPGILPFAHGLLRRALQAGDCALDATAGNGHDTLLLAQCVGAHGHVYAFDVQSCALAATQARLQQAGLLDRVTLIADSHAKLQQHVTVGLKAAVFNLGYLPGSDKTIITQPASTVSALTQALDLLLPGGVLVAVIYHGHSGGEAEQQAVEHWCAALDPQRALAVRYQLVNQSGPPPYVLAVEKR
ncbi:MAG: class I SAM-dependent methyltransferase [Brachymonas sp.]|nr:class I SAM-dependent methyltransferase [Brachymonas sp.]